MVEGVEDAVTTAAAHLSTGGLELLQAQPEYSLAFWALGKHEWAWPLSVLLSATT